MSVVIAVGHPYRGDDALGPAVAEELRRREPGLAIVETDGEPSRVIDAWEGQDVAVVVDAVRTGTAATGSVHRLEALNAGDRPAGTHSLGLGEAYALGEALGRLPGRLVVYGVEADEFSLGAPVSPAVAAAIGPVVDAVLTELGEPAGR